jgi:RNA polymerase sigma-70 factor (ECF subfamily)
VFQTAILPAFGVVQKEKKIDPQDYENFVGAILTKLNHFASALTYPNRELAKDLVQEAIVKGFQQYRAGGLELSGKTLGWFLTVIRNEFLMVKRKDKRIVDTEEGAENWFPSHDGDRDLQNAGLREVLSIAIQELPEDQRECVILVDIHQYDYEEAATTLGIPVGTVRSRLSRGRLKLAGKLAYLQNS